MTQVADPARTRSTRPPGRRTTRWSRSARLPAHTLSGTTGAARRPSRPAARSPRTPRTPASRPAPSPDPGRHPSAPPVRRLPAILSPPVTRLPAIPSPPVARLSAVPSPPVARVPAIPSPPVQRLPAILRPPLRWLTAPCRPVPRLPPTRPPVPRRPTRSSPPHSRRRAFPAAAAVRRPPAGHPPRPSATPRAHHQAPGHPQRHPRHDSTGAGGCLGPLEAAVRACRLGAIRAYRKSRPEIGRGPAPTRGHRRIRRAGRNADPDATRTRTEHGPDAVTRPCWRARQARK